MPGQAEREMMIRHGTRAMVLTPGTVIGAAVNDLRKRRRNIAAAERAKAEGYRWAFTVEHYAFPAAQVRRAKNPAHLIALTLKKIKSRGYQASGKKKKLSLLHFSQNLDAMREALRRLHA